MCTLAAWWCKGWWCTIGGPLWCKGWWCKGASSTWEMLRVSNVLALHEAEAEMHVPPVSKLIWRSGVSSYESCVVGPRVAPGRVSDIVSHRVSYRNPVAILMFRTSAERRVSYRVSYVVSARFIGIGGRRNALPYILTYIYIYMHIWIRILDTNYNVRYV
jgi:hypothetical protein